MKVFENSERFPFREDDSVCEDPIIVITQYFVHNDPRRHTEIKYCLRKNVENPHINRIILLNERIYSAEELGINSEKVEQVVIGARLRYADIHDYVDKLGLHGFIVYANSDIFFNNTIDNLHRSTLDREKIFMGLLRFEWNAANGSSRIFGPRHNSQDTWVFHTNFNVEKRFRKAFGFNFGKPGCDNKILYIMRLLGYKINNDPKNLQTFHYHTTEIRNYSLEDVIPNPYLFSCPYGYKLNQTYLPEMDKIVSLTDNFHKYTFEDNGVLRDYVEEKLSKKEAFIIPRIAGVENNVAHFGTLIYRDPSLYGFNKEAIDRQISTMKNNAGIKISTINGILKYSDMYMSAFEKCDMYAGWEPHGDVYRWIAQSHDYVTRKYKKSMMWAFAFDVFHSIHNRPWTTALRGKRLLIVSPFVDSMKAKLAKRAEIYGVDLFPDCEFVFLKPPQTQGANPSREFDVELSEFMGRVVALKDRFDIALCSCGGYGNLVCSGIYDMGKSAIYVGGVLQMYFGVYGMRWMKERPDVMKLYMNMEWSRPKENERPAGHQAIEGSCYW